MEAPKLNFSNNDNNLQFAQILRALRTEQGISLEDLSEKSQVPVVHIKTIEAGRFSRFDDFYLKMYLKKYAQSLGTELDILYSRAYGKKFDTSGSSTESSANSDPDMERRPAPQPRPVSRLTSNEGPRNLRHTTTHPPKPTPKKVQSHIKKPNIAKMETKEKLIKLAISLFCAAIAIFAIFFLIDFFQDLSNSNMSQPPVIDNPHNIISDTDETPNLENDPEENNTNNQAEQNVENLPESRETVIELDSHSGQIQTFDINTTGDEFDFRVEFSGPCWTLGTIDDEQFVMGQFATDENIEETFTFDEGATRVIDLNLGNIFEIGNLTINGEEVPIITDQTAHQRIILNITQN